MTNSRSLSWIDRGRWDSLLAAATQTEEAAPQRAQQARPRPRPAAPRPAASAAAAAVSAPAPRRTSSVPPVPPIPAVPAPAPAAVVPAPPLRPSYPPFECASQQLDERLQALVAWIESCVKCRAAFIADDNGLPVVEHMGAEQGHIAAASSILMMLASVRTLMRDSGGWLSLKMSSAVLNVVEVTTRWGRFGIGVVSDDLLPHEFLTALSAAVESAFHGETSQGEST